MNQTENVIQAENQFSFPGLSKFSASIVSNETISRVKQRTHDLVSVMKDAINNFLKTPEEIEAEFCSVRNSHIPVFAETNSRVEQEDNQWKTKDGFINIHTLEEAFKLSRDMEENY